MSEDNEIDLSDDDGHAGEDFASLLEEVGGAEEGAETITGELVAGPDMEAAGYRDLLETAFSTTSNLFGLGLSQDEIGELARAWGRVADHHLPDCPTQASPLADAAFTTAAIGVPHVLARMNAKPEEGQEGPEQEPKRASGNVVQIRPENPDAWAMEEERVW